MLDGRPFIQYRRLNYPIFGGMSAKLQRCHKKRCML